MANDCFSESHIQPEVWNMTCKGVLLKDVREEKKNKKKIAMALVKQQCDDKSNLEKVSFGSFCDFIFETSLCIINS